MRRLVTMLCVLSSAGLMSGCQAIRDGSEVAAKAKAYLEQTEVKIAEMKQWTEAKIAAAEADRARFEAITGAYDRNGDGTVTKDEALALVKDTAKGAILDGDKRSLLLDGEFWASIGVALAGGWVGLKGAKKGVGALHNAGRRALGEGDRTVG